MGAFNVTLTTHFTTSAIDDDDTHVITGGSTTATDTIAADSGLYYDKRFSIDSTSTEIWSDSITADFDFLWIESNQNDVEIQLVCNENGTVNTDDMELGFVVKLTAGVPFILSRDDSRNAHDVDTAGSADIPQSAWAAEIDDWETKWVADTIDRIEAYKASGSAIVRIFVAT